MITPEELLQELPQIGARRLTDWCSKGLMPRLSSHGRGKGRGKVYFWNDSDIVVRAQALLHAFENHATAAAAMLALVHAGFDVDPKAARRTWLKYLAEVEKHSNQKIDPHESAREFFWDRALQIIAKFSIPVTTSKDSLERLTAEGLLTIYARSGFRPSPDELTDTTDAANKYLAATTATSRYKDMAAPKMDEAIVSRVKELLRQSLSVTATKELIKGTTIEQFGQALSAMQQIVRASECWYSTQVAGNSTGEPVLEMRLLFRAILGAPLTAFFLQLIGAGYERKLRKSLQLVGVFAAICEANPGRTTSPENPEISEELQVVIRAIYLNLLEIWRGSSLFRVYYIA